MKLPSGQPATIDTAVPSKSTFHAHWQRFGYRWLAGLSVLCALALALLTVHDPYHLRMPEPWSFALAAENFAQGRWTLNRDEMAAARTAVRLQGARLTQYVEIAPEQWAFRQSPGYPLQMAPFTAVGWPRLANILLVILAALALYPTLAAWFNERLAFLGITLMLWSPINLLALHYTNMDTFAGGMWPLVAGALLLSYEKRDRTAKAVPFILLLAGFAAGWSVVVRITSLPLLAVLAGYGLYLIWAKQPTHPRRRRRGTKSRAKRQPFLDGIGWRHLIAFSLGGLLALAILLTYNWLTFGSPLDNGYLYPSPYDSHNLWSDTPLTEVPGGVSTWLAGGTLWDMIVTLFVHIRLWLRPATSAWLLWPLALLGLVYMFRQRPVVRSSWFILLWLLAAYAPYAGIIFFGVTRALAVPYDQTWGFFTPARYLITFTFPFVWTFTFFLSRWPKGWGMVIVGGYVVVGAGLFLATLAQ